MNRYPIHRGDIRSRYFTDGCLEIGISDGVEFPDGMELRRHIAHVGGIPAMYLSINLRVLPSRRVSDGTGNDADVPRMDTWCADSRMERVQPFFPRRHFAIRRRYN